MSDRREAGPYLSWEGVRARFPKNPTRLSSNEARREIVRCALRVMWSAWWWDMDAVCVYLFRIKEVVEEFEGKPFDHGDHWAAMDYK